MAMNIRSLAKGLVFCGEAQGKRQTYYVFESGAGYVVMSASRTKRASGYFNLVSRKAVARIRKSYAGKQDVTAKALATRSRGAGVRDALQALNITHAGSTAAVSGWMKGCMSEVLRAFFSYQVAVGNTMSE